MSRFLSRIRKDERGISIVEMLVVCVFVGLLSAAFSMLFSSTIRHSTEIGNQKDLETQMRAGLDPMIREFRQSYSGSAASPVESISASGTPSITFTTPDRSCVGSGCAFKLRRVTYRLTGGNFQRAFYTSTNDSSSSSFPTWPSGSPSNWVTLVSGVTNTTPFTFLDSTGATTTVASDVRNFSATLTAKAVNASRAATTYSVSASLRVSDS